MKVHTVPRRRRKAVSAVIGGVIMFGIIFSTVFTYFVTIQQANNQRAQLDQSSRAESLVLTTTTDASSNVYVNITNSGSGAVKIVGVFVGGKGIMTARLSSPSSTSPLVINAGATIKLSAGVCTGSSPCVPNGWVEAVTSLGSVFSVFYPQQAVSLAAQALSSGAIGDLYLQLTSYTYYAIVSCGTSSSGYCLSSPQGLAFSIPSSYAGSNPIAFSVSVTDLNPTQLNITLDSNSLIEHFMAKGDSFLLYTWFIVTNQSINIASSYTPLVLKYNVPTTLVFASSTVGTFTNPGPLSQSQIQGKLASVFILSHGWKGVQYSKISTTAANYGQNSPYVTTLYT